jgi:MoaA/NifB/PqqE/SkfB family radical SAM enzyme
MSNGAYAADKALCFPDRIEALKRGEHPSPVHLHIIVSDQCNLTCPGCAYRLPGYSSNELFTWDKMLNREAVDRVLYDCSTMGLRAVEFTGGGEPTVHPDLGRFLKVAKMLKLDSALITNGILLHRRQDDLISIVKDTCAWVRVSIDAATPDVYKRVRPPVGGNPRNFSDATEAVRDLRRNRDLFGIGPTIGVGFVVQRENWEEIHAATRLARDLGADNIRISGLFTPSGESYHAEYAEAAKDLEWRAIEDFDSPHFRVYGRFSQKIRDLHDRPDYLTCHYQRFTTYLGADANLYRCCVTAYSTPGLLARLSDHGMSLKKAWQSKEVRDRLENFDARACVRCQFNDRNRAIEAAMKSSGHLEYPSGVVHPTFV